MSFGAYVQGGQPPYGYPPEVMEFATQIHGKLDVVNTPLWSTEQLPSGQQAVRFFTTVYQDRVNGNIQTQRMMPQPYAFLVRSLRFVPLNQFYFETSVDATNLVSDLVQLVTRSYIRIVIGSRDYGEWPTHMIPAGSGLYLWGQAAFGGYASGTTNAWVYVNNGWPDVRNQYVLSKPLFIESMQPFEVSLNTQVGGLTFTVSPLTLQVILDGEFFRPVQ
jgi:hypothetical protein